MNSFRAPCGYNIIFFLGLVSRKRQVPSEFFYRLHNFQSFLFPLLFIKWATHQSIKLCIAWVGISSLPLKTKRDKMFLTLSKLWFHLLHKYLINQLTVFVDLYTVRRFKFEVSSKACLIARAIALSLIREEKLEYVVVGARRPLWGGMI